MQTTDACTACHTHTHTAHVVTHTDNATCASCHATSGGTPHRSIPSMSCQTCHTGQTMASLGHTVAIGTPSDCTSCHAPGQVPTIDNTCKKCHGVTAPYVDDGTLTSRSAVMHSNLNRAGFSWLNDAALDYNVLFDASKLSTCTTGGCTYGWDFGDTQTGAFTSSPTTSHVYSAGTYTATLTVRAAAGDVNASIGGVTPKFVGSTPLTLGHLHRQLAASRWILTTYPQVVPELSMLGQPGVMAQARQSRYKGRMRPRTSTTCIRERRHGPCSCTSRILA